MFVQIASFDGPRSAELVEAARRAGHDRIAPLVESDPQLRAGLLGSIRAVAADGAECIVVLARDAVALDRLDDLVMSSELLPGEDPRLLPGPSRVARYESAHAFGRLGELLAGAQS